MSSQNILDLIIAQAKLSRKETVKQQKIVETAIRMFAEKGYANTSTSEIAKASGVAEGTIFRHYGTKENLLLSVIVPFLKDSIPMLAHEFISEVSVDKFESSEDFFRALLRNRLHFLRENKEIFQIVIKEFLYREDLRKELLPHLDKNIFAYIHQAFDRFKARGELVDLPNNVLFRLVFTFVASYFISRFMMLPDEFFAEDEQEVKLLVQFILNGIKKQGC